MVAMFQKKSPKVGNLIFLSMISFVFIVSCALVLTKNTSLIRISEVRGESSKVKEQVFPPLPVLNSGATFPILSAQAVLAVDVTSGVSLYEKDPDKKLLPASTTKIVTALTAMDYFSPGDILTVKNVSVEGQKMHLVPGEKITFDDLLYGLLVYSANDAAEVIAQNYCLRALACTGQTATGICGRDAFVAAMNAKARELSLIDSHFTNPVGLDGAGHFTTARDLIRASEVAMQYPHFAEIVATKEKVVKSTDGKLAHYLANVNELLGKVDGVLGVKTGWTEAARENLITYIVRDNRKVMLVVLGSSDRFGETKGLIDWIFTNYKWEEVKYPTG
jgi:D-alanyl-D-alanine carboxypeptidase (penicillin-binding protein 5/6)